MSSKESFKASCGSCPIQAAGKRRCSVEDGLNPPNCPTALNPELTAKTLELYKEPENKRLNLAACAVEKAAYAKLDGSLRPVRPRITETVDFCKRMGYRRLGLLFCMSLRKEAAQVQQIFETNSFEVISVICKVGCTPKTTVGVPESDLLRPGSKESMCNPILQAEIVNEAEVDFNILLGLCVGHDTLVLKHAKAPATILAVKDRLLAHNPLACLYTLDSYYYSLKKPLLPAE